MARRRRSSGAQAHPADRFGEKLEDSDPEDDDICAQLREYLEYRSRGIDPPASLTEAWDRFYRTSLPRLRTSLRRLGLYEADREDCIQEVWSKLLARPDAVPARRQMTELTAWLLTVARNRAIDMMRRRRLSPADLNDQTLDIVDDGPAPPDMLDRRAMWSRLERLLAELAARGPDLSYQVFHLRLIEGRSGTEVARALGLTPEQVRFRLHRMTRRFRKSLDVANFARFLDE